MNANSAIVHTSVIVSPDTAYGVAARFGQVWIGTTVPGASYTLVTGDADALERFAAALMLAATEMREAALVEALAPSGQPSTGGAA